MYKKFTNFYRKHLFYHAMIHVAVGMGIGILITYPYVGAHPLRYGLAFLALGLIGHLYPLSSK